MLNYNYVKTGLNKCYRTTHVFMIGHLVYLSITTCILHCTYHCPYHCLYQFVAFRIKRLWNSCKLHKPVAGHVRPQIPNQYWFRFYAITKNGSVLVWLCRNMYRITNWHYLTAEIQWTLVLTHLTSHMFIILLHFGEPVFCNTGTMLGWTWGVAG